MIEYTFETNTKIDFTDYTVHGEQEILQDQFNGLQAVIDVMIELDSIQDGQQYKDEFKKHPNLVLA